MNINDWEKRFSEWSSPPSDSEQERIDNSVMAVRKAIANHDVLKDKEIEVFVQGSYKNNVNVKKDSDVDIAVLSKKTFIWEAVNDVIGDHVNSNHNPATYDYSTFKNDVQKALENHFGGSFVKRGNKAFNIRENTYRINADVVPFFEYRWYTDINEFSNGVALYTDDINKKLVYNFPEQRYKNGVQKNKETNMRFKRAVRIFKKLKISMLEVDSNYSYLNNFSGYFIECLIYNVPNSKFIADSFYDMVKDIIIYLYNELKNGNKHENWTEVDSIKYLFRTSQKWTKEEAIKFFHNAWNFVGYNNE